MPKLKHYTVAGPVGWFSNTNGRNWTGYHEAYEQIHATSIAKAKEGVLDRLSIKKRWADCWWCGKPDVIISPNPQP